MVPVDDAGVEQEVPPVGLVERLVPLEQPVDVPRVTEAALDRGVWVRPFRNLVYTMPPYVTSEDDLATITTALVGAVAEVTA